MKLLNSLEFPGVDSHHYRSEDHPRGACNPRPEVFEALGFENAMSITCLELFTPKTLIFDNVSSNFQKKSDRLSSK